MGVLQTAIAPDAAALRALPQVEKLMATPGARALAMEFSRDRVLRAIRAKLAELRERLLAGAPQSVSASTESLLADVRQKLTEARGRRLRRVINATGIAIHTNLGRAPLAAAAIEAMVEVAGAYCNLEIDLATGRRGSRYHAVAALLCELTGAEAALAVNNNAAAVLLALSALAAGGEVVISRGELVEIGGSFRIPEIIGQSGARLVEIGTTNKTRIADYEKAIGLATRVLLKVHQSNYRIVGFTSAPTREELADLAHSHGLPLVEDLGSGTVADLRELGLPYEPTVRDSIASGGDLVCFSGDKLLGGPQAGLIVGRKALVDRLASHPLLRAVRIDKFALAALEATLALFRDADARSVPVLAMLAQDDRTLARKARRLRRLLGKSAGLHVRLEEGIAYAGGGALPETAIATRLVTVQAEALGVAELARRLREHRPAIIGRIAEGRFVMDMRTVTESEIPEIAAAFQRVRTCAQFPSA